MFTRFFMCRLSTLRPLPFRLAINANALQHSLKEPMALVGMGSLLLASPQVLADTVNGYSHPAHATEATTKADTPVAPAASAAPASTSPQKLQSISVIGHRFESGGNQLVPAYAGGTVAAGGRMGVLGEQQSFDVPFNVIGYTAKGIQQQQMQSVGSVVQQDPSVVVGEGYGNYAQTYNIRGFNLTGDDISLGGLYGILPRQSVNPVGIERVEVFKGASAFLNGVSPTGTGAGGTINLEPKRAGNKPMLETTVGYDSRSHAYTSLDAGRRFGSDNQWGVRVNALRGQGNGATKGRNEGRNNAFALGLDYHGDKLRSSLDIGYEKDVYHGVRGGVYTSMLGDNAMPKAPSARTNYTPKWNFSRLENTYGMWRGEYDFAPHWTAYAALGASKTHEYGVYGSPYVLDSQGATSFTSRMNSVYDRKSFASQAGVRGNVHTGFISHDINLGYSGELTRSYSAYEMAFDNLGTSSLYTPGPITASNVYYYRGGNMGSPAITSRTRANGASLSDMASMFDNKVRLLAGVRYQQLTVRNWDSATRAPSSFSKNGATPVFGITYQPTTFASVYANYIQSLAPGESVPTGMGYTNQGQTLGIIRSKQAEAGLKLDFGTVGGSLSVFRIRQPSAAAHGTVYALDGQQENKGIELMTYGTPVDGWNMSGGVTYIDSKLSGLTTASNDGNRAIGVPKYKATLNNTWAVPGVKGLSLMGNVVYTSAQYADQANRYRLKPWATFNVGALYTTKLGTVPVTWRAEVDNVTNKGYWSSASSYGYVNMGDPRTLKLSMTTRF